MSVWYYITLGIYYVHTEHSTHFMSHTHGETRRGRPRTNYINYIQKVTGHQLPELTELSQNRENRRQLVVECADPQPPDYGVGTKTVGCHSRHHLNLSTIPFWADLD